MLRIERLFTSSPSEPEATGYGKDGKLKNAFHFPTTPATAAGINRLKLRISGAKATCPSK